MRSITTFAGLLQVEGLMIKVGIQISGPCAKFDVYRLAPASAWIQSLTASGPLFEECCSSSTEVGNSFAHPREDSTDLHSKEAGEAPSHALSVETLTAIGSVPDEICTAFAAILSPQQMFSYVERGGWTGPRKTLHTKTGQGAMWLAANDRGVARALGITVVAQTRALRHG